MTLSFNFARLRRAIQFLALTLAPLAAANGQDYLTAIGHPTFATSIPVDAGSLNVSNGNLQLSVPLASPTQRGGVLAPSEQLVYDGRIWQIVFNGSTYSWQPTNVPSSMAGWRFINAQSGQLSTITTINQYCDVYPPRAAWSLTQYSWIDPQGAVHGFLASTSRQYTTRQQNACYDSTQPDRTSADGLALDSSGYHIYIVSGQATVYDRYGTQVYPKVEDANGNYFSKDSNENLVDTRGNTPVIVTTNGNLTYYDVLGLNSALNRYTVTTETITVTTNFQQQAVAEWSGTLTAIQSIALPGNQGSYQFSYDSYGEVSSVTLPTGGTTSYGYSNYLDSYNNENRWLTSMTKDNNTWNYTPSVVTQCSSGGTGCVEKVTVTTPAPNADDTVYELTLNNGAWNSQIARWSGSSQSGGTLLQTNSTTYDFSNLCTSSLCVGSQYVKALSQTTTLNDVGLTTAEQFTYDNAAAGNVITDQIWDYYSGSQPTNPTIETDYTYGYTGLHAQPSVTQKDVVSYPSGSAATVSTETMNYDEQTPIATSGLPNHEVLTGAKANLTSVVDTTSGANIITKSYTLYDTGMVSAATDPNGTTQYGYDTSGAISTSTILPTPTSGVQIQTSSTIDASTGWTLTATDPAGNPTTYPSHDVFGRPQEIDYPDGGKATYSYTPTQTSEHHLFTGSTYSDLESQEDAYGRASRTAVLNGQSGNSWYQQDTCYDTRGRVSFQSTPYQGSGLTAAKVCSGSGTGYMYDALDRSINVTNADGPATIVYKGRAVETVDVNGVTIIQQYDGLGRLTVLCEVTSGSGLMPSGTTPSDCGTDIAATGFSTTYSYDLVNHITTVTQGVQTRTFQTDAIGRPILSVEPEAGQTTYAYTYNSNGLLVTRTKPTANQVNASVVTTTSTQYDSLGRVISISYSDQTPSKGFAYDTSAGWSNFNQANLVGKLSVVSTDGNSGGGSTYSYDTMGRLKEKHQCLPSGCGNGTLDKIFLSTYDLSGNLLSSSDGAGTTTSFSAYSLANEVGAVTSSTSGTLIGSISYGPFGSTSYTLGNGLATVNTYDSLGRASATYLCNGSTSVGCNGGNVVYQYSRTSKGAQVQSSCDLETTCYQFGYDGFNRLTSSSGTTQNFTYVYDRYGNRWQQNNPQGGPAALYTNFTNNQNQAYTYDAAGNLQNDGNHSYTYDADGNVTQVDGGVTAVYKYDGSNERVRIDQGSAATELAFDINGNRASTWDGVALNQVAGQYYIGTTPLAYYDFSTGSSATIAFQHQDLLGTERMRTASNGTVLGTFTSYAFGDGFTISSGSDSDQSHFAMLDHDAVTNTDHAQFRQYSNIQGRWMQPDPYSGSYNLTNPQSFNRYSYVSNGPIGFLDPQGLVSLPPPPPGPICGTACEIFTAGLPLLGSEIMGLFIHPPSFNGSLQGRPNGNSYYNNTNSTGNGMYTYHTPTALTTGNQGFYVAAGAVGAGAVGAAPGNPPPCVQSLANAMALDYSQPIHNGNTTQQHIQSRHMPGAGKRNVSTYWTQDFSVVKQLNFWTFLLGDQTVDSRGMTFELTFPNLRALLTPTSGLQNGVGYDGQGNDTLTNRFATLPNCKTAVTSYPIQ